MGELSITRDTSVAEIAKRSAEAWRLAAAEVSAKRGATFGPGVPKRRTELYVKRNFVPAAFVMLQDHRADRGTMRASTDGSIRRAFNFNTRDMIVEQRENDLFLVGIPRRTRSWINEKFQSARLGYVGTPDLAGDRSADEIAIWTLLSETATLTETFIDKARRSTPQRRSYVGLNPW